MQVGTTEDQSLYIKPYAAAHPGALAAGTVLDNITYIALVSWRHRGYQRKICQIDGLRTEVVKQ